MPTVKMAYEKRPSSVIYWDETAPNVRYEVGIGSDTAAAIQAAIQAHIDLRKAAGVDYPGRPQPAPSTITVTV